MTHVTIRYDAGTERILQSYWGDDTPKWVDNEIVGTKLTRIHISKSDREPKINDALASVEAGTDYDPDTETPVAKLCYDPDADELYAEVDIQPLQQ